MSSTQLFHGDSLDVLKTLPDNSVDAVVTDPPYGLSKEPDIVEVLTKWMAGEDYTHRGGGFMGKSWDSFVPGPSLWREVLRVLKPGGHLLCFAGTRTVDLMGISLRLAGFEIRDYIEWVYATGFPKSHNVSKAIDKAAGAERKVVGTKRVTPKGISGAEDRTATAAGSWGGVPRYVDVTVAATPEAAQWEGWGTALKPAHEPIIVARKPLDGTVAQNVLKWGTGAINIDGCRIGHGTGEARTVEYPDLRGGNYGSGGGRGTVEREVKDQGRWPANFVLSHHPDCEETGERTEQVGGGAKASSGFVDGYEKGDGFVGREVTSPVFSCVPGCPVAELDRQSGVRPGGASRFFYVTKPSKRERNAGLDGFEEKDWVQWQTGNGASGKPSSLSEGRNTKHRNIHPTVKPVELMRHLVRLVTPPGGTVLDPFVGSGTTGIAAVLEGFDFIGVDLDEEYLAIAQARIDYWKSEASDDKDAKMEPPTEQELSELPTPVLELEHQQATLFDEAA